MKTNTTGIPFLLLLLIYVPPVQGEPTLPLENFELKTPTSEPTPSLQAESLGDGLEMDRKRLEASHAVSQYNEKILELETEQGPHSHALSEQLRGLGDAYSSLNNHEMALQSYQRALQIHRINQGLHSLSQKPLLEKVIETQDTLDNHSALDDKHDYLLWLYRRNYDSNAPELVPVLVRVASWKLESFARNPGQESADQLFEADDLFEQSLRIIEQNPDMDNMVAIDSLLGIAEASFNAKYWMSSYRHGRDALLKIIELHRQSPELSKRSEAEALTLLGDWELSFNNRGSATEKYKEAYQLLAGDEKNANAIEHLFSKPRSVNTLNTGAILDKNQNASTINKNKPDVSVGGDGKPDKFDLKDLNLENTDYVLLELDISPRGRVRNLDILESNPADSVSFRRSARERVLEIPFRPRLENGEPVHTDDFVMLFRFE